MRLPWRRGRDAERRLASVDAGTRRAFVAALWAARGWVTEIEGQRVRATNHPEWADETLLVPNDGDVPKTPPSDVDAVVADAAAGPVRVVTSSDLHRLAMYAVDRSVGERLARTHLDAPLVAEERPSRSPVRADAVLLGVVAVVVMAAVVAAAGTSGGPVSDSPPDPATSQTPQSTPVSPSTDARVAVGNLLAPGLSNEGIVDAGTLSAAHSRAVADSSYVWFVSYREYRNSSRSVWPATRTERVVVENATHYRSDSGGWGALDGTPYVVSGVDAYADGTHRYVRDRVNGTARYERVPIYGRTLSGGERGTDLVYAERAGQYVRWYLTAETTRVHNIVTIDDRTYYRVTAIGSDYPGTENFSAVALIAPNGFVAEIRASYSLPDSDRVAEVHISYHDGNASVERPDWYDDARNATRPVLGGAGAAGSDSNAVTPVGRYSHDHQPPRPPHPNATDDESWSDWAVPADYRLLREQERERTRGERETAA